MCCKAYGNYMQCKAKHTPPSNLEQGQEKNVWGALPWTPAGTDAY